MRRGRVTTLWQRESVSKVLDLFYDGNSAEALDVFEAGGAYQDLRLMFINNEVEVFECVHCGNRVLGLILGLHPNQNVVCEAKNLLRL